MRPEDALRIILNELEFDLTDASKEFLPEAYALGKGYAQAKSGHEVLSGGFDRDIAFQSVGFQMDKINKMIQRMDAEILSINPAHFESVSEYMAEVGKTFDKFANRAHPIKYYAEQPFFDGWVQGGKEVAVELAKEKKVTEEEIGFTWRTAGDERVCPVCSSLDGKWFSLTGGEQVSWSSHIGCLTGGQNISTATGAANIENIKAGDYVLTHKNRFKQVLETSKRQYKGKVYRLTFEGNTIEVTPEHPVLTQRGWVEARSLRSSDKLVAKESLEGYHFPLQKRILKTFQPLFIN